jgi:hypothetical protein
MEDKMGVTFFFSKNIEDQYRKENEYYSVEVADNHSIPEIRIGPKDEAHKGFIASFSNWKQFNEFKEAVNDLYKRLEYISSVQNNLK